MLAPASPWSEQSLPLPPRQSGPCPRRRRNGNRRPPHPPVCHLRYSPGGRHPFQGCRRGCRRRSRREKWSHLHCHFQDGLYRRHRTGGDHFHYRAADCRRRCGRGNCGRFPRRRRACQRGCHGRSRVVSGTAEGSVRPIATKDPVDTVAVGEGVVVPAINEEAIIAGSHRLVYRFPFPSKGCRCR